jgi:hypothetical protein
MPITKATASSIAPAAKGDLVVGSATNDASVLAVGSANQVLTVDSSTTTGLKWASPSASLANYTLLNAGGTNLTGATDITVSGISGKDSLIIYIQSASSANASSEIKLRVNDGGDANFALCYMDDQTTNVINGDNTQGGYWLETYTRIGNSATNNIDIVLIMHGAGTVGAKPYTWSSYASIGTGGYSSWGNGFTTMASAVTSVTVNSSTGNFDAGKIFVYGA